MTGQDQATRKEALRALIVEDDALVRKMLEDVLSPRFSLAVAEDAESALVHLKDDGPFDLIVTDFQLPRGSGIDLLEQSIELCPDAVRMLITASQSMEVAQEAVNRAKVDRFFVKPLPLDDLLELAVNTVRERRARQQLDRRMAAYRESTPAQKARILVVDDDQGTLTVFETVLAEAGYEVTCAKDGQTALDQLGARTFELLLVDQRLPDGSGLELLVLARQIHPDLVSILITAFSSADSAIEAMEAGAYDYIRKPLQDIDSLPRTVRRAADHQALLRDRQRLLVDLVNVNETLVAAQQDLRRQLEDTLLMQDATVMGFTRLAEYRDMETGEHLERMRNYSRIIARELEGTAGFEEIDDAFVEAIYKAAPLHDIGKVGIPDAILRKPGALTPDEWEVMRTHARIGGDTLEEAERRTGRNDRASLLHFGKHIAYFHHEKWSGEGYPFGKKGEDIPVEARIVTVADSYDAITSKRVYKPSFPHSEAREIMLRLSGSQFDPRMIEAFLGAEEKVLEVRRKFANDELV